LPGSFTLALDAMGGDQGPRASFEAALSALDKYPCLSILWVGSETLLAPFFTDIPGCRQKFLKRLQLIPTSGVVELYDDAANALRKKQDSSMFTALQLVAEGKAQACVSSGNSGALMAMGRYLLKMRDGFDRPALARHIPTAKGDCLVLDMGANLEPDAQQLYQFGILGHELQTSLEENIEPVIGLLNISSESGKGNANIQAADKLLYADPGLPYIGYIEPHEVFAGQARLVVCDGYAGNILIKTAEGVSRMMTESALQHFSKAQGKCLLQSWKEQFDPSRLNGAFLLGLQSLVIKSHSYADGIALRHAIDTACMYVALSLRY
jgi:glycerol-3-phosphate acyltransferase PlsX